MRKSEKKGPNFLGLLLPILRLTFLEASCNFRKFGIEKNYGYFFDLTGIQVLCAHFKSVSSAFSEVDMTVKLAAL